MIWLSALGIVLLLCFGLVLFVGAPYLPTLTPQVKAALKLANLKPGSTLLELGCGDGKVLIAAANQGMNAVGYELNPILVVIARLRTLKYRSNVRVIWGDFWHKPWPEAEAVFVFLLPKYMKKLDTKLAQYAVKPVKLISFAFEVPDKKPAVKSSGLYMYEYPGK